MPVSALDAVRAGCFAASFLAGRGIVNQRRGRTGQIGLLEGDNALQISSIHQLYRQFQRNFVTVLLSTVMAGLVPAIHVFPTNVVAKTWMPGTSPGMTKEKACMSGPQVQIPLRLQFSDAHNAALVGGHEAREQVTHGDILRLHGVAAGGHFQPRLGELPDSL